MQVKVQDGLQRLIVFPFQIINANLIYFRLDVNLLFNFNFCVCALVCMFHSSVFTMASNIQAEEDEPMHPARLDMTRGSLQDILDGEDVNVSTALPTVPLDATNPFINPNQTLADIIPDRNLGPLASLKITDADLIIRNLNSQLNAAVKKNDQSTTLLRRMDQRQKEIEAELAALKAEKDAAIQEKWDHTINQERLAENIRNNLEKEYANKEQNYVRQLKQELRAKTSSIRDQCKMEFDQELKKLKEEWNQERLNTNEQHNVKISQVLKEIDALKEHLRTQQKAEVVEPGDKISDLKTTAFDFVPGTVNTKRGGAVNLHEETILWSKNEDASPIPPRKHVQSTTTIIGNTMSAVTSEFKKMREPKLAKLKGGITSGASLFFKSWVKDVRAVILERAMSNAEALQLVKDYTEGKARQQVEFYIVSTQNPSFEGLIDNLKTSFQSGEDEATVKGEFYSHKQYSKESVDDFADVLQLLARKVLNVDPLFQAFMNKSLCQQLANGLKDPSHSISARSLLNQQPEVQFAVFRSDLANILGCRVRAVGAKGVLCNAAMAPESPDTPVPAKGRKTEEDSTIAAQLSMCIKDNKELHKKLDAFDPSKIIEVVAQAVAGGYPKSSHKPYAYQKQQASQCSNPFSKPYLGPPREPQVTPGADGSLNPALSCRYCKDTGHNVSNCAKVKRKEAPKAAAASQQSNTANKGN